jgi:2-polyprenyl-3-methyl-5-hydroxy-6-metoxy-1,4-benzoquinol methylase
MKSSPIINDAPHTMLLETIPKNLKKVVEVGTASGAMARAYKALSPESHYIGIEIFEEYYELSKKTCDESYLANIENCEDIWPNIADCDGWILGDVIEHLYDPWKLFHKIRKTIPSDGHICCSIPNAQNWMLQAKLNIGDFRYVETGLLDKTHIRWFTRQTILELFKNTGFQIKSMRAKNYNAAAAKKYIQIIGDFAELSKANREIAVRDALAFQYIIHAVPNPDYTIPK